MEAFRLGNWGNRIRGDFETGLIFALKIEDGKNGQVQSARLISIGLMKTVRAEFLKVKLLFRGLRKKGFPLLAPFFQGKKVGCFLVSGNGRPTKALPEYV
jgi:hypothetical protein